MSSHLGGVARFRVQKLLYERSVCQWIQELASFESTNIPFFSTSFSVLRCSQLPNLQLLRDGVQTLESFRDSQSHLARILVWIICRASLHKEGRFPTTCFSQSRECSFSQVSLRLFSCYKCIAEVTNLLATPREYSFSQLSLRLFSWYKRIAEVNNNAPTGASAKHLKAFSKSGELPSFKSSNILISSTSSSVRCSHLMSLQLLRDGGRFPTSCFSDPREYSFSYVNLRRMPP